MKLTHYRQELRPRHVFATSQGSVDYKQTIVVQLEHEGITGLGEVVASALYGQTLEACEAALDSMLPLLGDDPFALESIIARLIARHGDQRAAIAGVDSALHDWIGKRLNIPVWRLLGLDRRATHDFHDRRGRHGCSARQSGRSPGRRATTH